MLIPLGVMVVRALIPVPVLAECRERAGHLEDKPTSRIAAVVIVGIWLLLAAAAIYYFISS